MTKKAVAEIDESSGNSTGTHKISGKNEKWNGKQSKAAASGKHSLNNNGAVNFSAGKNGNN